MAAMRQMTSFFMILGFYAPVSPGLKDSISILNENSRYSIKIGIFPH